MTFNASDARQLSQKAQVDRTVDANLSEVRRYAAAGNSGSYYKTVYNDTSVNQRARERLGKLGFHVDGEHVSW